MVIRTCIALLLSISPLLAQLRPGDPASVGISRAGLDRVNALLESEVRHGLGAAAILIARQGTIVLHKGFGHLSPDPGSSKVEPDSVYIVASITKPVTATALMMLVERGKVSLADPVSTYLPELPEAKKQGARTRSAGRILRHAGHVTGEHRAAPSPRPLERIRQPQLYHSAVIHPGTAFRYQSMGILLAAEIVAKLWNSAPRVRAKGNFRAARMQQRPSAWAACVFADTVRVQDSGETSWNSNSSEAWRNMWPSLGRHAYHHSGPEHPAPDFLNVCGRRPIPEARSRVH
jgi:hypothetical protein